MVNLKLKKQRTRIARTIKDLRSLKSEAKNIKDSINSLRYLSRNYRKGRAIK